MADISIRVSVDANVVRDLVQRARSQLDARDILDAAGEDQLKWVLKNFEAEGLEGKWAPLKPETIARRKKGRGAGGQKILQDQRDLFKSFNRGNEGHVYRRDAHEIEVGSSLNYAATHHYGDKKRGIPARPILPSESKQRELLRDTLAAVEREFVRATGSR